MLELEDDERNEMLRLDDSQMADVARYANRYPNIELQYEIADSDNLQA